MGTSKPKIIERYGAKVSDHTESYEAVVFWSWSSQDGRLVPRGNYLCLQ